MINLGKHIDAKYRCNTHLLKVVRRAFTPAGYILSVYVGVDRSIDRSRYVTYKLLKCCSFKRSLCSLQCSNNKWWGRFLQCVGAHACAQGGRETSPLSSRDRGKETTTTSIISSDTISTYILYPESTWSFPFQADPGNPTLPKDSCCCWNNRQPGRLGYNDIYEL